MRIRIFALAVVVIAVFLAAIWNSTFTRNFQYFVGALPVEGEFAGLTGELPENWVLLYSRGTGTIFDGKLYGLIPTNRFNSWKEDKLVILGTDERNSAIELTQLVDADAEKYKYYAEVNQCTLVPTVSASENACAKVNVNGKTVLVITSKKTNILVFMQERIVISAAREIPLDELLKVFG
jgi:hypothetical protein